MADCSTIREADRSLGTGERKPSMKSVNGQQARTIRWLLRKGTSKAWAHLAIFGAILIAVAAIVVSPLLLTLWGGFKKINWTQLGNIGQAYNAASAVLAALALVGVVGSLIFQARQGRADRMQHARDRQFQLLNLVLENPALYGPMLSGWTATTDHEIRRSLFMHLWVNSLAMMYEMGTLTETDLRQEFQAGLSTRAGRAWWNDAGSWCKLDDATSRAERRFRRILHDEYRRVTSEGALIDREIALTVPDQREREKIPVITGAAIGICVGLLVGSRVFGSRPHYLTQLNRQ
jgi:hypothetical protein